MRLIFISLLAFLLYACNSDIFVDDFTPDVTELTMEGKDSFRTINFKSSDWTTLTVTSSDPLGEMTVTPAGGTPFSGKTLDGDGSISIKSWATDILVTRRGAVVTVQVNYAIGNDLRLLWLEAESERANERFMIDVAIQCVKGLEITDVEYNLDSWGSTGMDSYELDGLILDPLAPAPVDWQPTLPQGLLTFYKMSTDTESEPLLKAIVGEKIEVPTRTYLTWSNWALRGEEVPIMVYKSYTHFRHYPPIPAFKLQPGDKVSLWAEMEACEFNAIIKVKNNFTDEENEIVTYVYIYEPAGYNFRVNEN